MRKSGRRRAGTGFPRRWIIIALALLIPVGCGEQSPPPPEPRPAPTPAEPPRTALPPRDVIPSSPPEVLVPPAPAPTPEPPRFVIPATTPPDVKTPATKTSATETSEEENARSTPNAPNESADSDPNRPAPRAIILTEAQRAALKGSTLRIYNWSGYIAPELISAFESRFGVRVVYDSYDSLEQARETLLRGGVYDVIIGPLALFEDLLERGELQPVTLDALGGYDYLDADLLDRLAVIDFGNLYAIPYLWGMTGFAYNAEEIAARSTNRTPLDSWAMLLDPKIVSQVSSCGVSLLDSPDEMFQVTQRYLSAKGDEHGDAESALRAVRNFTRGFRSSQDNRGLLTGEFCLSAIWSGDAARMRREGAQADPPVEIVFSIPREGALLWMDVMVVPDGAVNLEAAHLWIDYLLEPETAAQLAREAGYASPNLGALDFFDEEIRSDPALYPNARLRERLFLDRRGKLTPEEMDARERSWRRIRR